jgi:para-aminobenzoate synthetase / 4-amino-4-deoxychorismate lyase
LTASPEHPVVCRFDDRLAGRSMQLAGPRGLVVARRLGEAPDVLAEVELAGQAGLFAGGFVTYEAAPGLDPALAVRTRSGADPLDGLPLDWFGRFAEARPVEPLKPPGRSERTSPKWCWAMGATEYGHKVAAIRQRIGEGWTYQANFTTPPDQPRRSRSVGVVRTAQRRPRRPLPRLH